MYDQSNEAYHPLKLADQGEALTLENGKNCNLHNLNLEYAETAIFRCCSVSSRSRNSLATG